MEAYSWVIRRWRPAGTPPPPGPRSWARQAACAAGGGDWFGSDTVDVSEEVAICSGCRVRQACLDYALDAGESFGIWGGLTPKERAALVRQLRRTTVAATRQVA